MRVQERRRKTKVQRRRIARVTSQNVSSIIEKNAFDINRFFETDFRGERNLFQRFKKNRSLKFQFFGLIFLSKILPFFPSQPANKLIATLINSRLGILGHPKT